MKCFKKHKTKNITVGIRECRTCDNNMRCEECAYPKENEMLKAEIERLQNEVDVLTQQIMKPFHEEREKCIKCEKELKISAMQDFWNELKKRSTLDWRIVSTITGDNLLNEIKRNGG